MTSEELNEFQEVLKLYMDTFEPSIIDQFLKKYPHLVNSPKVNNFSELLMQVASQADEKNINISATLSEMIESIFLFHEFTPINNFYHSSMSHINKARELFLTYSTHFDLEQDLTHETICRLILTTKQRIDMSNGNPFKTTPAKIAPEVKTSLGILAALIEKKVIQDCVIDSINDYEPFSQETEIDNENDEFYFSFHTEGILKLQSNTYFSHLSELFILYKKFNSYLADEQDFYLTILQTLTQYIKEVPVNPNTLLEFKNSPHYLKGLSSYLNTEGQFFQQDFYLENIQNKVNELEISIEKSLIEQSIKEKTFPIKKSKI